MNLSNLPSGYSVNDIEEAQREPLCPRCHSNDLEDISGDYPTGVKMDGYEEMAWEDGYECQACGLKFVIVVH